MSLAFYRDTGFEVRADVGSVDALGSQLAPGASGYIPLSWSRRRSIGITEDERRTIVEMMAKGSYVWIILAVTSDLDAMFARLSGQWGRGLVQEPVQQPDGVRDCAIRDPWDLVRINEVRLSQAPHQDEQHHGQRGPATPAPPPRWP